MSFWDLFQWWNLIFTLPFGIGLLPLLLQILSFARPAHVGHGAPPGHHHLPHIGGHHLPQAGHGHISAHDASSHDAALSTPHAASHPGNTEGSGVASRLLSGLGLGKVPVMLVVSIFCFIWGASGVAANQVFSRILHAPALYIWPSLFCALSLAFISTGGLTRAIARAIPQFESYGTEEALLVGRTARAAYEFDASPGSAFLLDDQQNRIQVRCRSHNGAAIPSGAEVLLLEYDPQSRIFTAVRFEREMPADDQPQLQKQNRIQSRS